MMEGMPERITEGIRPVNHRCGPAPPGGSVDQYAGKGNGGGGGYGEAIKEIKVSRRFANSFLDERDFEVKVRFLRDPRHNTTPHVRFRSPSSRAQPYVPGALPCIGV